MKNSTRLLTIAIPTFNRAKNLDKLLRQFLDENLDNVEIIISDDASQDDTTEIIQKYVQKLPLRFVRQKTNIGFNSNIRTLYELADSRYIWFLCDDDTIYKNAVDTVKKALIEYEPVVAVFSTSWIDPYGRKRVADTPHTKLYTQLNEFDTYQPLMRTTFLSIVVIEKRKSIEDITKTDYKNNIFFQLSLSIYLLSDKMRFLEYHSSPIVHRNVGFKYGEFFKFYLVDHLKAVESVPNSFDFQLFVDWSHKNLSNALQLYLSQKLGLYRYNGNPTSETKKLLHKYYGNFHTLIRMFPFFNVVIPSFILKFIYIIRLVSIHGIGRALPIYHENINRAAKDKRRTGFTEYR